MTTTRAPEVNKGVYTTWIALTTQGPSLNPSCSSSIYIRPYLATPLLVAFDPWYGSVIDNEVTCLPIQATSWFFGQSTTPLVSLGPFVCPSGYETGTTSSLNGESTVVGCCPSSYTFQGLTDINPGQCISPLTPGQVYTAKALSGSQWVDTTSTMASSSTIIGAQVNGYIFAVISTSTSSILPTPAILSKPAIQSIPSILSTSPTSRKLSSTTSITTGLSTAVTSLSTGAKAGIGVGVSLGIIGIASLIAVIFFMSRRHSSQPTKSESPGQEYQD